MRGVVLTQLNAPLEIHELEIRETAGDFVPVDIICTGICGAQLQEISGDKGNSKYLPHCLGHEAIGRLEDGTKCIVHWRKGDGDGGHSVTYSNGNGIMPKDWAVGAGPIATWAERPWIARNRLTPAPNDFPDELGCLLGCALSTALCVAEYTANIKMGESVLVIGCGGVGLCFIKAASLRGATVTGFDQHIEKQARSMDCGASDFEWRTGCIEGDYNVVLDTTGKNLQLALDHIAPSGRIILIGQGTQSVIMDGSVFDGNGVTITATQAGGFYPPRDIPRFVSAWRNGKLNCEGIVSDRFKLSEVNNAIEAARSKTAGRVLLYV